MDASSTHAKYLSKYPIKANSSCVIASCAVEDKYVEKIARDNLCLQTLLQQLQSSKQVVYCLVLYQNFYCYLLSSNNLLKGAAE
jgi:hypothetical protein